MNYKPPTRKRPQQEEEPKTTSEKPVAIYFQWFNAYIGHPKWEMHFDNIVTCLKEDIENQVIIKDSSDYFELKDHYVRLKNQMSDPSFTPLDAVVDIALNTFEGARLLN